MTKTTDDTPTAEEIEAEARAAHKEDLRSEHEAWKQRMGKVPPAADLDSPFMSLRDERKRTIIGYPPPIGSSDRPAPPTAKRPREIPSPPKRYGAGRLLDLLDQLGVTAPPGCADAFAQALTLKDRARTEPAQVVEGMVEKSSPNVDQFRADVADLLAEGAITQAEARQQLERIGGDTKAKAQKAVRDGLIKASVDAYRTAWLSLQEHGGRILDDLNTIVADAVAEQSRSAAVIPELQDRWDLAHECAAHLRQFAVTTIPGLDPKNMAWRFARLDLLQGWIVEHARMPVPSTYHIEGTSYRLLLHTFPAPGPLTSSPGDAYAGGGVIPHELMGTLNAGNARYPTCHDAAQHPELEPGVFSAEQVYDNIQAVCLAQGTWKR